MSSIRQPEATKRSSLDNGADLAPKRCARRDDDVGSSVEKHRVTVIGSGNWGSTIAKVIAENTKQHPDLFEPEVQMWVFEETVTIPKESPHYDAAPADGGQQRKLSEVINQCHENVKYLPGVTLPHNVVANPSLREAARGASVLVFNLPHQFIGKVCRELRGHILPFARGISCIKGVDVTDSEISLFAESISTELAIYCGALSGANIASEIAAEKWSETTIGYDPPPVDASRVASRAPSPAPRPGTPNAATAAEAEPQQPHLDTRGRQPKMPLTPLPAEYPPLDHELFRILFHRPYFHVQMVSDVAGVSLCGALKNIIALAAGFVDGRGWGDNAKAAIMRVGLVEMVRFGKEFFGHSVRTATFTECSAGVADLITSCSGGRNFRCAKLAVERGLTVAEVEKVELNGQMLQGTTTAKEVVGFLRAHGRADGFPLFCAVHGILEGTYTVDDIPMLIA